MQSSRVKFLEPVLGSGRAIVSQELFLPPNTISKR
jgi:hypothetical protein